MSLQTHLAELERKHDALERKLSESRAHPSAADAEIAELKRRKLVLKDQINKLRVPADSIH